jgi:hypothetical protein
MLVVHPKKLAPDQQSQSEAREWRDLLLLM